MSTDKIINILLKEFDMEKGGSIKTANKITFAAIKIEELFHTLEKENETNKSLLEDARNYIVDTEEHGLDRETLKSRADQYREMLKLK